MKLVLKDESPRPFEDLNTKFTHAYLQHYSIYHPNVTLIFLFWKGSLSLKVDVYDEDKGNDEESHLENDLVCAMQQNISIKATPWPNEKAAQNALLLGELRSSGGLPKLTLTVRYE